MTPFRPRFLTFAYPYGFCWLPLLRSVDYFHWSGSFSATLWKRQSRAATFPTKVYFSMFKFGTFKVISYFCRWNSKTMKQNTYQTISSMVSPLTKIGGGKFLSSTTLRSLFLPVLIIPVAFSFLCTSCESKKFVVK